MYCYPIKSDYPYKKKKKQTHWFSSLDQKTETQDKRLRLSFHCFDPLYNRSKCLSVLSNPKQNWPPPLSCLHNNIHIYKCIFQFMLANIFCIHFSIFVFNTIRVSGYPDLKVYIEPEFAQYPIFFLQ